MAALKNLALDIRDLYKYRALIWTLVVKELKLRYRGSILGFFWSFLNPLLLMAVYALVFSFICESRWNTTPSLCSAGCCRGYGFRLRF